MRNKLAAGVITSVIVLVLVLSGPASAFSLRVSVLDPTVYSGGEIKFVLTAETQNEETGIDSVTLLLDGEVDYECRFDENATIISGCTNMEIEKLDSSYSEYGYGYQKLESVKFQVRMNTSGYNTGKYKTNLMVTQGSGSSTKRGTTINIKEPRKGIVDCSIRGSGGTLTVEDKDLGKANKINFYVPLENAANGKGYLTGQKGKDRFSYNFEVIEVISNNDDEASILVTGKYTLGLNKEVKEDAVILLIKDGKVNLDGEYISLEDMRITFRKGC